MYCYIRANCHKLRKVEEFDDKKIEPNKDFNRKKLLDEESKMIHQLDKSTTYCVQILVDIPDISMDKFAEKTYRNYRPVDGYGYYEINISEAGDIDPFANVIYKDKDDKMFTALGSAITHLPKQNWKGVFTQSKSTETKLTKGTKFLYCACSNVVIAYYKEYDITEECTEVDFCEKNIHGYRTNWSYHSYFQFYEPMYIKRNQRIIVKKKNGELITGPGVRHLILGPNVDDGLNLIKPPNPSDHEEWECVYVQSRDLKRKLVPSPKPDINYKYLFCAMMEPIPETAHYEVYDIKENCKMVDSAKKCIPGFKLGRGYGYYEFKEKELIKPEKRVVLVDKQKRLFTGSGALFFCTKGCYVLDDLKKETFPPPFLKETKWEHIFVQNNSKRRELHQGSKFLYLEYKINSYDIT